MDPVNRRGAESSVSERIFRGERNVELMVSEIISHREVLHAGRNRYQEHLIERLREGLLNNVPPGLIIVPGSIQLNHYNNRENESINLRMTGLAVPEPVIVPPEAIDLPVDGTTFSECTCDVCQEVPTSSLIGSGGNWDRMVSQTAAAAAAANQFGIAIQQVVGVLQGTTPGGVFDEKSRIDPEAETRAQALLKRLVSEEEYKRFKEKKCVLVKSNRGWYLVGTGYSTSITCYPDFHSKKVRRYCLNIAEWGYVPTDLLITRLLMIRNAEDKFLSAAQDQTYPMYRLNRTGRVREFLGINTDWADNWQRPKLSLKEALETTAPLYAS